MTANLFDDDGQPTVMPTVTVAPGASVANRNAVYHQTKPRHESCRDRVFRHIKNMATIGATREEIADALNMRLATVCGRVNELITGDNPPVIESTIKRKTRSGSNAVVLVSRDAISN